MQLAATDIKVTSSKTSVDRISGNFVSDVNMLISKSHQPGLLTASYTYDRRLSDKLPVSYSSLGEFLVKGFVLNTRNMMQVDIELLRLHQCQGHRNTVLML